MDDLVAWIELLFDDCSFRAPFGIGWQLDRAEPPITATITPADRPTAEIVLVRNDLLGRISFAASLQAYLDLEFDRPVPPCPIHGAGLLPVRVGDEMQWRCEAGDFDCRVGDYVEALWPPGLGEDPNRVPLMLARRFSRRRLTGIRSFGVERHDGRWLARVKLRPEADQAAISAAAHPVVIDAEEVDGLRTIRVQRSATPTEPAHRALTLMGATILLAALRGRLHRAPDAAAYDFVVGDTWVRLQPEHRLGPIDGPVVLDGSGKPFADEGDAVCCVGGFGRTGPVRGRTPVFHAGELRVYE